MVENDERYPSQVSGKHTSFVLRCWVGAQGEVRARLVDVGTGRRYPLRNLAKLPGLIEQAIQLGSNRTEIPSSTALTEEQDSKRRDR
jgi:hypothetical protein